MYVCQCCQWCERPGTRRYFVHADCIFTDWAGFHSPLTIKFQSVMSVRNTIFRNMNLHVEIADVSFEGIVHFEDVRFANVTLEHGAVVSTTLNDYQQAIGFYVNYYADDDAEFDVQVSPVLPSEQGVFAEDFVVVNDTMSDCVYLLAIRGTVLPGCSKISLDARKRVVERSWDGSIVRSSTGVPFTLGPGYDYAVDYDQAAAPVGSAAYDYEGLLSTLSLCKQRFFKLTSNHSLSESHAYGEFLEHGLSTPAYVLIVSATDAL